MTFKNSLLAFALVSFALSSANTSTAQRHSGMVINLGVKKHLFSLTDVSGEKMENFKGNIFPFAGISYAHVLSPKFSATYEFDISSAKGTYIEKYDADYELFPSANPSEEPDITIDLKSTITLSVRLMAHYRLVEGLFVSAGLGYDRSSFSQIESDQTGQNYPRLPSEMKPTAYNFNVIGGVGYATDQFRIDLRYNAGLSNFIYNDKYRQDANPDTWRYDKLTVSQATLTFGYFIGNK